jgi:hypothetical protein
MRRETEASGKVSSQQGPAQWENAAGSTGEATVPVRVPRGGAATGKVGEEAPRSGVRYNADGSIAWTFLTEISAVLSTIETGLRSHVTPQTGGRRGGEVENREIRRPRRLRAGPNSRVRSAVAQARRCAGQGCAQPVGRTGDDPLELRYHHFSIVMIDDPTLKDLGVDRAAGRPRTGAPGDARGVRRAGRGL